MRLPFVSVIIPHYRDLDGLALCLQSLQQQTYPADRFEIVVADNNSPEGEAAVSDVIDGRARLIVITEKGAGPARNGGVSVARGEILAFIDCDCVPEPNWIAEGIAALPAYDFIGGRVTVLVADMLRMTAPEAFERVFAFDFKTYITKKGFTGAGNLFCSRGVFDAVGGFRADVSEDVEWSRRATAKGFRLGYAPRAVVGHPARRTWTELWAKWRRVNAETYGLYREQKAGRFKWLLRSLALPPSAVVHAPKVLMSDQLVSMPQRILAIGMLFKLRFARLVDAIALLGTGRKD